VVVDHFEFFPIVSRTKKIQTDPLPGMPVNGEAWRSGVGDIGGGFVGKGTLDTISAERSDHIKVAAAGLDARVLIAERIDDGAVDAAVGSARYAAAINMVSGNGAGAGTPIQGNRVRGHGTWRRGRSGG